MATATFTPFHAFALDKHHGVHNFNPSGGHTFKVFATPDTPSTSADAVKADLTETTSAGGYSGPVTLTISSSSQTSGTYKLVIADPAAWTGTGSGFTLRALVMFNDTASGDPLVGFWDYGSTITVGAGETLTLDLDATAGVFTST
jgi:hypothetical protein